MKLRLATRRSQLALWQARHVADALAAAYPQLTVELVPLTTSGDRHQRGRLADIGGKGLFVKELELALQERRADIAVHSMKDVPSVLAEAFCIAAVLERADPRDAFLASRWGSLDALPAGARIGTSSLRRQAQLKARRADLDVVPLRGNVDSRLQRLAAGELDAIILASAGLARLGLGGEVRHYLEADQSLPAAGQGAIGIECRVDDEQSRTLARVLDDAPSRCAVDAERAFAARLGASCHSPVAAWARPGGSGELALDGLVGMPDGSRIVRGSRRGGIERPRALGEALAVELLERGAAAILAAIGHGPQGGASIG